MRRPARRLKDFVVVVTGASSGNGRAAVHAFAKAGDDAWRVTGGWRGRRRAPRPGALLALGLAAGAAGLLAASAGRRKATN